MNNTESFDVKILKDSLNKVDKEIADNTLQILKNGLSPKIV